MALNFTAQSIETVARLAAFGRDSFVQLDLGSDYVAWVNDQSTGSWDSIVLLSHAHDEGSRLIGGHELAELLSSYSPEALHFRNLVTGEVA